MARLDRLGPVKDVAQIGSVLGRSFRRHLLRAIASVDETALQQALIRLADADLLHHRGTPPDATYIFKHALIQETAYHSMLVSRRRQLHGRVADTLVDTFDLGGANVFLLACGMVEEAEPRYTRDITTREYASAASRVVAGRASCRLVLSRSDRNRKEPDDAELDRPCNAALSPQARNIDRRSRIGAAVAEVPRLS